MSEVILIKQGAIATGEDWRDNWITPDNILQIVTYFFETIGESWFDPCPIEPNFNGLALNWNDRAAYINPPFSQYGSVTPKSRNKDGWAYKSNQGSEHIWLSHHSHSSSWFQHLMNNASAMCLLTQRVRFIDPRDMKESESTAIGKCQTLTYTGAHVEDFRNWFSNLGKVVIF